MYLSLALNSEFLKSRDNACSSGFITDTWLCLILNAGWRDRWSNGWIGLWRMSPLSRGKMHFEWINYCSINNIPTPRNSSCAEAHHPLIEITCSRVEERALLWLVS